MAHQGDISEPEDGEILDENGGSACGQEGEYEQRSVLYDKRRSGRRHPQGTSGRSRVEKHYTVRSSGRRKSQGGSYNRGRQSTPQSRSRSGGSHGYTNHGSRRKKSNARARSPSSSTHTGSVKQEPSSRHRFKTNGSSNKLSRKAAHNGRKCHVHGGTSSKIGEGREKSQSRHKKKAEDVKRSGLDKSAAANKIGGVQNQCSSQKQGGCRGNYTDDSPFVAMNSSSLSSANAPLVNGATVPNGLVGTYPFAYSSNAETEPVTDDDEVQIIPEEEVNRGRKSPLIVTLESTDTSDDECSNDDKCSKDDKTAKSAEQPVTEEEKITIHDCTCSSSDCAYCGSKPPGSIEHQVVVSVESSSTNDDKPTTTGSAPTLTSASNVLDDGDQDGDGSEIDEDLAVLELRKKLLADLSEKTAKLDNADVSKASHSTFGDSDVVGNSGEDSRKNRSETLENTEETSDEENALREVLLLQITSNKNKKLLEDGQNVSLSDDKTKGISPGSSSRNIEPLSSSPTSPNLPIGNILTPQSSDAKPLSSRDGNVPSRYRRGRNNRSRNNKRGGGNPLQPTQLSPYAVPETRHHRVIRVGAEPLRNPPNTINHHHDNVKKLPVNDLRNKLRNRRNEQQQAQDLTQLFPDFGVADTDMRKETAAKNMLDNSSDMTIRRTVNFDPPSSSESAASSTARTYMAPIAVDVPATGEARDVPYMLRQAFPTIQVENDCPGPRQHTQFPRLHDQIEPLASTAFLLESGFPIPMETHLSSLNLMTNLTLPVAEPLLMSNVSPHISPGSYAPCWNVVPAADVDHRRQQFINHMQQSGSTPPLGVGMVENDRNVFPNPVYSSFSTANLVSLSESLTIQRPNSFIPPGNAVPDLESGIVEEEDDSSLFRRCPDGVYNLEGQDGNVPPSELYGPNIMTRCGNNATELPPAGYAQSCIAETNVTFVELTQTEETLTYCQAAGMNDSALTRSFPGWDTQNFPTVTVITTFISSSEAVNDGQLATTVFPRLPTNAEVTRSGTRPICSVREQGSTQIRQVDATTANSVERFPTVKKEKAEDGKDTISVNENKSPPAKRRRVFENVNENSADSKGTSTSSAGNDNGPRTGPNKSTPSDTLEDECSNEENCVDDSKEEKSVASMNQAQSSSSSDRKEDDPPIDSEDSCPVVFVSIANVCLDMELSKAPNILEEGLGLKDSSVSILSSLTGIQSESSLVGKSDPIVEALPKLLSSAVKLIASTLANPSSVSKPSITSTVSSGTTGVKTSASTLNHPPSTAATEPINNPDGSLIDKSSEVQSPQVTSNSSMVSSSPLKLGSSDSLNSENAMSNPTQGTNSRPHTTTSHGFGTILSSVQTYTSPIAASSSSVSTPKSSPTGRELKVRNSPLLELCSAIPLRESTCNQQTTSPVVPDSTTTGLVSSGPSRRRAIKRPVVEVPNTSPIIPLPKVQIPQPSPKKLILSEALLSVPESTRKKSLQTSQKEAIQKKHIPVLQNRQVLKNSKPVTKENVVVNSSVTAKSPVPILSKSKASPKIVRPPTMLQPKPVVPIVVPIADGDTTEDEEDEDGKKKDRGDRRKRNMAEKMKKTEPNSSPSVDQIVTSATTSDPAGPEFQNFLDKFLKNIRKNVDELEMGKGQGSRKTQSLTGDTGHSQVGTKQPDLKTTVTKTTSLHSQMADLESVLASTTTCSEEAGGIVKYAEQPTQNAAVEVNNSPSIIVRTTQPSTSRESSSEKKLSVNEPPKAVTPRARQVTPTPTNLAAAESKKKKSQVELASVSQQPGSSGSLSSILPAVLPALKPGPSSVVTNTTSANDILSNPRALIESLAHRVTETKDQIQLSFKEKELLQIRQDCYNEYKGILRDLQQHTRLTNFDTKLGQEIAELQRKMEAMKKKRETAQKKASDLNKAIKEKSKAALNHKKSCLNLAGEVKKLGERVIGSNKYKVPDIFVENINELIRSLKTMDSKQSENLQRERGVTFRQLILDEGTFCTTQAPTESPATFSKVGATLAQVLNAVTAGVPSSPSTSTSRLAAEPQRPRNPTPSVPVHAKDNVATVRNNERDAGNNQGQVIRDTIKEVQSKREGKNGRDDAMEVEAVPSCSNSDEKMPEFITKRVSGNLIDLDNPEEGKEEAGAEPVSEDRLCLSEGDVLSAVLTVNIKRMNDENREPSVLLTMEETGAPRLDPNLPICPASLSEGEICEKQDCKLQHI